MQQFVPRVEVVRERFAEVSGRVAAAASAAGRDPAAVRVLVATKYVAVEHLGAARCRRAPYRREPRSGYGGQACSFRRPLRWDFIGHLQSRKTRPVLPLVSLIHSVDSLSVVQEIEARATNVTEVLLEVNIAERRARAASPPTRSTRSLTAAGDGKVRFTGLMCMPPLFDDAEEARPFFARTRELADRLSTDVAGHVYFRPAIDGDECRLRGRGAEGATIVRVGSVLF